MILYINVTEIAARNELVNYLHIVISACVKVMIPTSMCLAIHSHLMTSRLWSCQVLYFQLTNHE